MLGRMAAADVGVRATVDELDMSCIGRDSGWNRSKNEAGFCKESNGGYFGLRRRLKISYSSLAVTG